MLKDSSQQIVEKFIKQIGGVVAPLGEKARPLEKDKASGASEGLEPLSDGATTGSRGATLGSTGTSRASNASV